MSTYPNGHSHSVSVLVTNRVASYHPRRNLRTLLSSLAYNHLIRLLRCVESGFSNTALNVLPSETTCRCLIPSSYRLGLAGDPLNDVYIYMRARSGPAPLSQDPPSQTLSTTAGYASVADYGILRRTRGMRSLRPFHRPTTNRGGQLGPPSSKQNAFPSQCFLQLFEHTFNMLAVKPDFLQTI
jgi:hypothetical protein